MQNIEIIYESADYIVLSKPAGLLMHKIRIKNNELKEEETLTDWIVSKYPEIKSVGDDPETRPGIVHRIDRETSGVVVIARNAKYFEYLKKKFTEQNITKNYLALVYGELKEDDGVISKPIGIKNGTVKRTVYGGKMVKEAVTYFKVIKRYKDYTLIIASPKTGRTHQIRVHLSSIAHPIVGDKLYGGKKEKKSLLKISRHFLHAKEITFESKPGELVTFVAEMPKDMENIISELK